MAISTHRPPISQYLRPLHHFLTPIDFTSQQSTTVSGQFSEPMASEKRLLEIYLRGVLSCQFKSDGGSCCKMPTIADWL
jgi:hypothetical protein